jgi:hypothetical protein
MRRKIATLPAALLLLLTLFGFAGAADTSPDELTRLVTAYELTMARVEAYGVVLAGIADWAEAHPEQAKALRAKAPQGLANVEQAAAVLESEPALKALLDHQQLSGRDFVLIPAAMLQARLAVLGEAQGRSMPPGQINPKNLALAKAKAARMDAIMHQAAAARLRAFGR